MSLSVINDITQILKTPNLSLVNFIKPTILFSQQFSI